LQQVFQILPLDINPSDTNFFGEVSDGGFSFFYQNDADKMITGLSVFIFEKKNININIASDLQKIFNDQDLLKRTFKNIFVSYSFCESVLTPRVHYYEKQNSENINLVFGDATTGIILTDHIEALDLYNAYRIPADVHEVINSHYSNANTIHQYSVLVKQLSPGGNILRVIFYHHKIIIVLQKDGKLQIIQAFSYKTAEDVVYHMLNVCNQFNVAEPDVELCGMIEKDSALFTEIQKYFLNINFAALPSELLYTDEIKEYPSQFFSHLFSFALCV
jgi:hypothetical protein